jgi:hypothetical protein
MGYRGTDDRPPPEDLLRSHNAFVKSDNAFQRTVRLRQALWREKEGYPIGLDHVQPQQATVSSNTEFPTTASYIRNGAR